MPGKEAEAAAAVWPSLEAHVRDILDSLPNGVLTVDSEWRVTSVNRAARQILGIEETEALGRLCRKVLKADSCIGECPLRVTLETGRSTCDYEVHAVASDGRPLHLRVNTAVLRDPSGRATGGVLSFHDATLQKRLEADLVGRADFHGMIGRSRAMREVYSLLEEVSGSGSTVLIDGESGTGKELAARAVQLLSPRRDKPFVRVNCGAFAESLLESELFGHVRGAFTGAHRDRPGRFELADGGTVFLDEVGEASPGVQLRLLRILQEQEFERVGSSETIRVDVRVIAATHIPLMQLVRDGRFREDLFYRLSVIPVSLPPLRERIEDIPMLTEHFIRRYARFTGKPVRGLSPRSLDRLLDHPWPGNVRELENALEYACVRCRGDLIQDVHLPEAIRRASRTARAPSPVTDPKVVPPSRARGHHNNANQLLAALQASRWNRQEAAQRLGISRTTLWRQMITMGMTDRSSMM